MEQILIDSYKVFMKRSDYDNAFIALKKLWKEWETLDERKVVYELVKQFRFAVAHVDTKEARDYHRQSYLLTARDIFDDFMIYIEWGKPIAKQFWLPRRKSRLREVADCLQDMEDDLMDELFISLPPRVGKTTLVLFFLIWIILKYVDESNLYCSFSDKPVLAFYKGILQILQDPYTYAWQDVFPECHLSSTNAKDYMININRDKRYANFTARSIDGSLNGSCNCSKYMVGDDLVDGIKEAKSKSRLLSLWDSVQNDFLTRGVGAHLKHIWIGTRWSLIDPQGMRMELLKHEPSYANIRWKAINIPALDENDESNFDYPFGIGNSTATYHQIRAGFERKGDWASWAAQFLGEPIERDGAVFSRDTLRFYNGVLPDPNEVTPDRVYIAVDPAWGGGDYVSAPICVQYNQDIYIVDVVFDNSDKKITQPKIAEKAVKHSVASIKVEATKMTAEYADGIDEQLKDRNYRCNVTRSTSHYTGNGKEQRILDKAPDIREHMIFLEEDKRSKEYQMFMENLYSFTMNGNNKHDDAPDSLAMAIGDAFFVPEYVEIVRRQW